MSCVSKVHLFLRWNVHTHRFGYRHRTTQLKTLYTTGCTSRRIQPSFSTVTKSITTRRGIRIRTHQGFFVGPRAMLTSAPPTTDFPSNPSASWKTHCHVLNQPTSLMRWIGIIGHSVRGMYNISAASRSSLMFYSNLPQPPHLSGHPRRRTAAVACGVTVALGF